jgi:hypothetical protein
VSVNNDAGVCGAEVTLTAPTTADNCGVQSVSNDHPSSSYPVGITTVTWTVTDIHGKTNTATQTVTVTDNEKPTWLTTAGSLNATVYCGQNAALTAAQALAPVAVDNCSGVTSVIKTAGQFVSTGAGGAGTYTNTWMATDAAGNNSATVFTQVITVQGVSIDASASSFAIQNTQTTANLSATVSTLSGTPVAADVVTFTVTNSAGVVVASGTENTSSSGIASLPVTISTFPIGVYKAVAISGSGCASSTAYLTIYDPNGDFITGGGWITSPAGALVGTTTTGKANFGLNAKYKKGNNQVDGNTEFQFQAGNFNFKSSTLDAGTLVISGAKATYRGVGTVNGSGNYGFVVVAVDGDENGGGGTDLFRIKIWDKSQGNTVVYDNNMGADENGLPTTALGGGSIVIHKNNAKKNQMVATSRATLPAAPVFTLRAYPNPTTSQFTVQINSSNSADKVQLRVMDMSGRVVELFNNLSANQSLQLGSRYRPGLYILEMIQGGQKQQLKLMKTPD